MGSARSIYVKRHSHLFGVDRGGCCLGDAVIEMISRSIDPARRFTLEQPKARLRQTESEIK